MNILSEIKTEVEKSFSYENAAHDFDHTMRVYKLCNHIGMIENANMTVLLLSALLHDIARHEQDKSKGKICHAERGAEVAKDLLKNFNADEKTISEVCHCISTHRSRKDNAPESKEAKILFDADKLDGIGAVGIGRAFMFAQSVGAKLHNDEGTDVFLTEEYGPDDTAYREYAVKLKNVKDKMLTNEGKRIAAERSNFMDEFFKRLNEEVNGDL